MNEMKSGQLSSAKKMKLKAREYEKTLNQEQPDNLYS